MKKIITTIILLLMALIALAQNKAEIIVSYDSTYPDNQGRPSSTKMS